MSNTKSEGSVSSAGKLPQPVKGTEGTTVKKTRKKRPPSQIILAKARRTTVQAVAWKALEKMIGKSMKLIDKELEEGQKVMLLDKDGAPILDSDGIPKTAMMGGNVKVGMWLVDKITGNTGGLLLQQIDADMSTMEGVVSAAQKAVQMVLDREMALQDAEKLIDLLMRYAAMRAFDGIEELRNIVNDLNGKTINGATGAPSSMMPTWGKLQAMKAVNEDRPAE